MVRCYLFLDQLLENGQAALDEILTDTVADTEILRAAEVIAGDQQQVVLLCLFGEGGSGAAGSLDEEVEGTVGLGHLVAVGGQGFRKQAAVTVIGLKVGAQT